MVRALVPLVGRGLSVTRNVQTDSSVLIVYRSASVCTPLLVIKLTGIARVSLAGRALYATKNATRGPMVLIAPKRVDVKMMLLVLDSVESVLV